MNYTDVNSIEIIDLEKITGKRNGGAKIPTNRIHITSPKPNDANMSFSRDMSSCILKEGFNRMNYAVNNLTGDVFFVFSNKGYPIKMYKNANSVRIGNRMIIQSLLKLINVRPFPRSIWLTISEDLSKTADVKTFKIIKIDQ